MDGNLAINSHFENMSEKDSMDMADHYMGIEEGNRIIGAFEEVDTGGYTEYDKHWELLMPIVEKISKIKLPEAENHFDTHHPTTFGMLNAETGRPMFRFYCCAVFEAGTLIEAAWMACVDFIKSYKP